MNIFNKRIKRTMALLVLTSMTAVYAGGDSDDANEKIGVIKRCSKKVARCFKNASNLLTAESSSSSFLKISKLLCYCLIFAGFVTTLKNGMTNDSINAAFLKSLSKSFSNKTYFEACNYESYYHHNLSLCCYTLYNLIQCQNSTDAIISFPESQWDSRIVLFISGFIFLCIYKILTMIEVCHQQPKENSGKKLKSGQEAFWTEWTELDGAPIVLPQQFS